MNRILFRADGKKSLGMGHIIRCLALADVLKKEYTKIAIVFFTKYYEGKKILENKGYEVKSISDDGFLGIRDICEKDTLLVTDFLDTDPSYITRLKEIKGLRILSIDNNTRLKIIDSDVLLNANVFYEGECKIIGSTHYYLGPKYMILRKEFSDVHKEKAIQDAICSILVIFGGTDSRCSTLKVLEILKGIDPCIEIKVIIGPGFSYNNELKEFLCNSKRRYSIYRNPENIVKIMKEADIAISAAGIVLYELATLGVPTIVIPQEPHQIDIANAFGKAGACLNLGEPSLANDVLYKTTQMLIRNRELREQLSTNAQRFVDGRGIDRVTEIIKTLIMKK